MGLDPMKFSNQVGQKLSELLGAHARAELADLPGDDQLTARLGGALICVAEELRGPVERGARVAPLVELCARWLSTLLEPVTGEGGASSPGDTG